jgi:hypothetical protein
MFDIRQSKIAQANSLHQVTSEHDLLRPLHFTLPRKVTKKAPRPGIQQDYSDLWYHLFQLDTMNRPDEIISYHA